MPINHGGVSVYRLLTTWMAAASPICSAIQFAHPFRPHSPRPIDTGNGENNGEGCLLDGSVSFPSGSPVSSIA